MYKSEESDHETVLLRPTTHASSPQVADVCSNHAVMKSIRADKQCSY